jgi:hypothetical protein
MAAPARAVCFPVPQLRLVRQNQPERDQAQQIAEAVLAIKATSGMKGKVSMPCGAGATLMHGTCPQIGAHGKRDCGGWI